MASTPIQGPASLVVDGDLSLEETALHLAARIPPALGCDTALDHASANQQHEVQAAAINDMNAPVIEGLANLVVDGDNQLVLFLEHCRNNKLDLVEQFLESRPELANHAIHMACAGGNTRLLEILLEACPDCISAQNSLGETAFHVAARNGNNLAFKVLLEFGSFHENRSNIFNKKDSAGNTALDYASANQQNQRTCAICLGSMKRGQGQAIFTAECSHSFHFNCIAKNVAHGNRQCPICRSNWKDVPLQFQNNVAPQRDHNRRITPLDSLPNTEPQVFSDDEPLPPTSGDPTSPASSTPVTIKAAPEFPAIAAADTVSSFAVLIGVQAPRLLEDVRSLERAPIDLVTVLDVSGSMVGSKISLLKRALGFVIQNLGPFDRLSIVAFSSTARRIFPLRRMTEAGRVDAVRAISSVTASGGTNIVEGLRKGVRVLEERLAKNPVASIILLSDGQDTHNTDNNRYRRSSNSSSQREVVEYLNLLPPAICRNNNGGLNEAQVPMIPVHTFGFGSDHDAAAMHAISDASGGTFSFIESVGMVQDSFARCIGGLLSVMSQELQITVRSVLSGATILSIPSGRYQNEISDEGKQGVINVGDLYAEEEKHFLVHLSVPPLVSTTEDDEKTQLLEIACSYKDVVSKENVQVSARVDIRRPEDVSPSDLIPSLDVDRQRNRLLVAEAIARAQEMAETGNFEGARALLEGCRLALLSSPSAQAGDGLCTWLEAELREIRDRMVNVDMYEHTGRAYVLSGMSSHSAQRATTRGDSSTQSMIFSGNASQTAAAFGYDTPTMVSMVTKSQTLNSLVPRPNK